MLVGSFDYSLDDNGRLMIPAKFRNELGNNLFLMKGFDGCISVYKEVDFQKYVSKISTLSFEKKKTREYERLLLETVVELSLDKVGRIQLPLKTLQKYAIGKQIKIIGLLDHLEIWDSDKWNSYHEERDKEFEDIAEELLFNDEE